MKLVKVVSLSLVVCVASLAGTQIARADPEDDRPWARGVSPEDRERALELFRIANESFVDSQYADAAKLYREALRSWDHPAIRGNLAVALIHLDRTVEAYEHLQAALRWGAAPFEEHLHQQLVTNEKLLRGQLARVQVACDVPEAQVTLDGEDLLAGRGTVARVVKAGQHQVVARKSGHLTFTQQFTAFPDRPVEIRVVLVPLEQAGGYERRWAVWKPWTVLGAGVAVLGIGVGLELAAQADMDQYEEEIARACPDGCVPSDLPGAVRDLESTARLENGLAVGAFVVGGLAVVTGGIMVFLNQPRRVRLEESGRRIGVVPIVSPDTRGIAFSVPF